MRFPNRLSSRKRRPSNNPVGSAVSLLYSSDLHEQRWATTRRGRRARAGGVAEPLARTHKDLSAVSPLVSPLSASASVVDASRATNPLEEQSMISAALSPQPSHCGHPGAAGAPQMAQGGGGSRHSTPPQPSSHAHSPVDWSHSPCAEQKSSPSSHRVHGVVDGSGPAPRFRRVRRWARDLTPARHRRAAASMGARACGVWCALTVNIYP